MPVLVCFLYDPFARKHLNQKARAADAAILEEKKIADDYLGLRPEVADQTHLGEAHIALCLRKSAEIRWSCPALSSASTALAVKVEGVAMFSIFTPRLVSRATKSPPGWPSSLPSRGRP